MTENEIWAKAVAELYKRHGNVLSARSIDEFASYVAALATPSVASPRSNVIGASPVCLDCNAAGIQNCSHFDECDGNWVYKPAPQILEDEMSHKHCVFCGEEIPCPRPTSFSLICTSALNTTIPDTTGNRYHAVFLGRKDASRIPQQTAAAPAASPQCTCGADRTGPSAEAHDSGCPAAAPVGEPGRTPTISFDGISYDCAECGPHQTVLCHHWQALFERAYTAIELAAPPDQGAPGTREAQSDSER
jgi:hypothetical protein